MTLVGGKGIFILVLKFCPTESKNRKQRLSIECIMWEVILRSRSYFGMSAVWPCPRLYGVMTLKWPEGMAPCELCQYLKVDGVENGKMLTLLVQETEYFGFEGSISQCHACWCTGSWSRQSISRHGIGCVGQTTCIVVLQLISSTWVKPNSSNDSKCWCIFFNL